MNTLTQSDVAIKVAALNVQIVDDSTNDNELYYEMCQDEILELIEIEKREKREEILFKRNYINNLFSNE